MIISISGTPGSGKSTLAKMLAKKIDYKRYYIGGLRRAMAKEKGLTLKELNAIGEKEPWTDTEVDQYQKKLGQSEDNFIIEGRTSFLMIPQSLKIFIDVNEKIGAKRVFQELKKSGNQRNEDDNLKSVKDVLQSHRKRIASDKKRYHKYYQTDFYNKALYDCVLDTSDLNVEEAFNKLYSYVKEKLGNFKQKKRH
jgi:CMP/dCMP kinase